MKKIFTLISMALVAISVNAQEETQVFSVGNGDFNVTDKAQGIQVKVEDKACANVVILSSPYPDNEYEFVSYDATNQVNIYDETQPKAPWSLETADGNSLSVIQSEFTSYLKGQGNPFITEDFQWEYDDNNNRMKLVDANTTNTVFTTGGDKLPVRGTYIKVTPIVDGKLKLGITVPNGNHPFYVIPVDDATTVYTPMTADKFTIKGYFRTNTWNTDENKTPFDVTMPEDLIIQNANVTYTEYGESVTKQVKQLFLGVVEFNVVKGKTYWIFSPKSQIGFYGFTYTYDKAAFESADPLPNPDIPTSIETVKNVEKAIINNGVIYNLAGQKADKSQKGILIQNGKKFVNK